MIYACCKWKARKTLSLFEVFQKENKSQHHQVEMKKGTSKIIEPYGNESWSYYSIACWSEQLLRFYLAGSRGGSGSERCERQEPPKSFMENLRLEAIIEQGFGSLVCERLRRITTPVSAVKGSRRQGKRHPSLRGRPREIFQMQSSCRTNVIHVCRAMSEAIPGSRNVAKTFVLETRQYYANQINRPKDMIIE